MRILAWTSPPTSPVQQLAAVKLVTGMALLRSTWHLPPGDLFEREGALVRPPRADHDRPNLVAEHYDTLRAVALVSVAAWTLGCDHWSVRAVANISTLAVHHHNAALVPDSWNYSTHLNFFLLMLSLYSEEEQRDPTVATTLLEAMQICYAWGYLQAAVSKLRNSGVHWANGSTLRASWAESRSSLGRWLSRRDRRWAAAASTAALAFEAGFLPALLLPGRQRQLLGLAALGFHGATKATLGISFWHYNWYALPLFGVPDTAAEWGSRLAKSRSHPHSWWARSSSGGA